MTHSVSACPSLCAAKRAATKRKSLSLVVSLS